MRPYSRYQRELFECQNVSNVCSLRYICFQTLFVFEKLLVTGMNELGVVCTIKLRCLFTATHDPTMDVNCGETTFFTLRKSIGVVYHEANVCSYKRESTDR